MNEQRQVYKNQFKIIPSATKLAESSLLGEIMIFVNHKRTFMTTKDWFALQGIIKQLESGKSNHPAKVLKAMERKFESIKSNYEHQR